MVEDDYDAEGGGALPDFLQDPAGIPRRHWRWMLLALVLGLAGTAAAVWNHKLTYTARSSVLVTSQQIPEGLIPSVISEDPFSRLNAVVGQVRSRQKLTVLIEELDLYPEQRQKMLMEDVVGIMRESIHVSAHDEMGDRRGRGQTARVFYLSFTYPEAERAAVVANRLAGVFLEAGIQSRIERSQEITRFLRQELTRAEETLREQNRLISEFNEEYRGELPGELNSNLSKLDRLTQQRQSLRTALSEIDARRSGPVAMIADPNSPAARLADLQSQYQQAISVYTSEHPTVRALARQIRALEKEVASGGYEATASPGSSFARAQLSAEAGRIRAQISDVERQIDDLEGRVSRTPKHQEELSALTERAMVAREKYLEFLRKVNAAELAQTVETAQQGAQVTIMDRAYTPAGPDSSRETVALIGLGAALGLALGAGVLRELIDPVMVAEAQVQRITGLPSLGSVARIA